MNNQRIGFFILAMLTALPMLAAAYDIFSRTTHFPHERILPAIRILAATPPLPDGSALASRRRFFRAVLDAAGTGDVAFVWEDASGALAVGMDRLSAAFCFSRLDEEHPEVRVPGVACGQGRYGRWALEARRVVAGGLPWRWWWFSWTPLPALIWMEARRRRRRRQEAQLAETARALSQGAALPPIDPEAPAAEALAVMAVAIREREERLAEQLRTIEEQNQEILQNREKFIAQEKIVTVGHLAAGLAHELGNPLASLIAHIEWLAENSTDPVFRKHFDMMKSETGRMDELLRRLLQLARGEAPGKMRQPVAEAATGAVELLRHQKWCAGVDFRLEIEAAAGLWVQTDLKSILVNLLLNAVQAMNGKGTVTVRARREANRLFLDVADTGPGVPEELARTIFEPFFTTKDPGQGTGMGLPASRMLAQQAGGDLRCMPGASGGLFVLEFPVVSENPEERENG